MKKILFHGNCQSCVISKWLKQNYSHKYQFIDCVDVGLTPFWGKSPTFSWFTESNKIKVSDIKTRIDIQTKIKEADIFVFMHHTSTFDEINTINLHDNIASGLKICLPNSRFGAYPICKWSLGPYVEYVKQNITSNPSKIAKYIKTEDDPIFTELLYKQYPFVECGEGSLSNNSRKHKECVDLYDNAIDINSFIEANWKDHLLFCTKNHPTEMYYKEILSKLLTLLGEDLDILEGGTRPIRYPKGEGSGKVINVNEFLFFTKHIPNLLLPPDIQLKSFNGNPNNIR